MIDGWGMLSAFQSSPFYLDWVDTLVCYGMITLFGKVSVGGYIMLALFLNGLKQCIVGRFC